MVGRARAHGFAGIVLAHGLYGNVTEFLEQPQAERCAYCVDVVSTLKVIAADTNLGPIPEYRGRGQPPTRLPRTAGGSSIVTGN